MDVDELAVPESSPRVAPRWRVGETIENPVTGERGVVRVAPTTSNGHLLVVDLCVRPGGAVVGEHVHPALTETFTVVRGRLVVRHGWREFLAYPGPGWRCRQGSPTTGGTPARRRHGWWSKCGPPSGSPR